MGRLESVDAVKGFAIFSVICIHTNPFFKEGVDLPSYYYFLYLLLDNFFRFAVPVFFLFSGFFFSKHLDKIQTGEHSIKPQLLRLLKIFIFWCAVYSVSYNTKILVDQGFLGMVKQTYWKWGSLFNSPIQLIFQGTKQHLWFLMSLFLITALCSQLVKVVKVNMLFWVSFAVFLIAVFCKAYAPLINFDTAIFNTRNGPFFGLIFFVIGILLAQVQPSKSCFRIGLGVLLLGYCLQLIEISMLHVFFGIDLIQDFVFSTVLLGLGAGLIGLSGTNLLMKGFFGKIGKYSLGMFAIHFIFVDLLSIVDSLLYSVVWELCYPLIVLALSYYAVIFLSRFKALQQFLR